MPRKTDNHDWEKFLGRRRVEGDGGNFHPAHEGKIVLVTGAGGSIGSALAMKIAASSPKLVILLDNCEQNLYQIHTELNRLAYGPRFVSTLGDIADRPLLDEIFTQHHPAIVYHAAAFKHVPVMEANPLAAIRNNSLGTHALAQAVNEHGAERLIMISTDKAVDPHSVMGASKRLAELVLLTLGNMRTRMNSIRLGNVLGSQGSVGLLFLQQISRSGPVTVTHSEVRRYFLTLDQALECILAGAALDSSSGIWAPELGQPLKVQDLAEHLIRNAGFKPIDDIPISQIGLRAGDKMVEQLVSSRESMESETKFGLHRVSSPHPCPHELETAFEELAEILRRRDVAALIETLGRLVPEYRPSVALLTLVKESKIEAHRA